MLSDEVKQHLKKLQGYLESDVLDFESRLFILRAIWEIRIAARK